MSELGVLEPHELSGYSRTAYHQAVKCPLCDSLAGLELHSEKLPVIGLGTIRIGYGYCTECGHIYQTTPPPADKLEEYYSRFSNYTLNLKPCKITERLLGFAGDPKSVYEVGCGTGRHLQYFRGWRGSHVKGCEPSKRACQAAWENFQIVVDCGTEAECLPTVKDQDLIIFSGVLEHLPDPVGALQRASAALATDGRLLIEVPCATSPESLPPGWLAFEHLHYYTPATIKNLLTLGGFDLIESRITYQDFIYPVITCLAKQAERGLAIERCPTASSEFLSRYIARDDAYWDATRAKLAGSDRRIVIWGAGIHTSQLLDRIPGLVDRVEYIVDTDPQKHGGKLGGIDVCPPSTYLNTYSCYEGGGAPLLLISSFANEWDIVKELAAYDVPEGLQIRLYH